MWLMCHHALVSCQVLNAPAGLGSQAADVRALAIMTLTKLVQAGGPAQMQPHLADLTVAMLESLSGMEVSSADKSTG